jgi:hypothetical protein
MKTRIFIFVALFAAVFMLQSQTQVGQNLWGDAMHDRFGWSVGIGNTDGSLAVGAPYADVNGTSSGLARIFQFDGTSWSQRGNDINGENAGDEFGQSIDLNDDGQIVIIGAPYNENYTGHLRVYQWEEAANDWIQIGQDIDGENIGDWLGYSCTINSAGNIVAGGALRNDDAGTDAGSVRAYQLSGNSWVTNGAGY